MLKEKKSFMLEAFRVLYSLKLLTIASKFREISICYLHMTAHANICK